MTQANHFDQPTHKENISYVYKTHKHHSQHRVHIMCTNHAHKLVSSCITGISRSKMGLLRKLNSQNKLDRSTHWMKKIIPHPMCTHVEHFWCTLLHEKWKIHEKLWLQSRFLYISYFSVVGSIESMQYGYSFDEESNSASNECFCSNF